VPNGDAVTRHQISSRVRNSPLTCGFIVIRPEACEVVMGGLKSNLIPRTCQHDTDAAMPKYHQFVWLQP
jgi:hypothetical protein